MLTFGSYIKSRRLELRLSLREFCVRHQLDPGAWSKMERGINPPPKALDALATLLDLDPEELRVLASAWTPPLAVAEEDLLAGLPFVHTRDGKPLTVEQIESLAEKLRAAHTPD